jgi:hypothetical protein
VDHAGDRIIKSGEGSKTDPCHYAPCKMPTYKLEVTSVQ